MDPTVTFEPLTPARWQSFEELFGTRGGYGGCWCMWFRQTGKEYAAGRGQRNKEAMRQVVDSGQPPGIIAFVDGEPAAWVSFSPREAFPRLDRSPRMKRVDDTPVWSIVCFYIGQRFRGQGMMGKLLEAAIDYARREGAQVLEAYPKDPSAGPVSTDAAYNGLVDVFRAAGFTEVARRAPIQPVMRLKLDTGESVPFAPTPPRM
jgi:GNAT superfamily N-acetyltransferase